MNFMRLIFLAGILICGACSSTNTRSNSESLIDVIKTEDGDVLGNATSTKILLPDGRTKFETRRIYNISTKNVGTSRIYDTSFRISSVSGEIETLGNTYETGGSSATILAKIEGNLAHVERIADSNKQVSTVSLPEDIRFDNGVGILRNWPLDVPLNNSYSALDIFTPTIERRTLTEIGYDPVRLVRTISEDRFRGDKLLSRIELTVDNRGKLISSETPTFGTNLVSSKVSKNNSKPEKGRTADLLGSVLVKSPVRITKSARDGKIRYRFSNIPDTDFVLPETGEQRSRQENGQLIIDVCAQCGDGLPKDKAYLETALKSTFWLQSDVEEFKRAAKQVKNNSSSDLQIMRRLTNRVFRRMKEVDFTGHVSALEAYNRKSGDCTESAVLLAALGRAAGIPTKVASGIVYSRERYHGVSNVFMPHVWTLAYVDGQWVSFDAALEEFDSTHIVFSISNGDPISIASGHQLAGLMKLESLQEVRRRPEG